MPWLAALQREGSFVATHAPELPGSEWVNAACGVSPAHHGYLHTSQLRVGTYESVETDARVVRSEPFYEPLARAGLQTVVVDLCVDRPRPQKNLVQVVDWATEFQLWHYCTTPRAEREFVDAVCPDHPLTNYGSTDPSEQNLVALDRKLERGSALKAQLVTALMDRYPDWQVFFAGFCEIHKAGHFFWQYQDPAPSGLWRAQSSAGRGAAASLRAARPPSAGCRRTRGSADQRHPGGRPRNACQSAG